MLNRLQALFKYWALFGLMPYTQNNIYKRQQLKQQQIYTFLLLVGVLLFGFHGIIVLPLQNMLVSNLVSLIVFLSQILGNTVILIEALLTLEQHDHFFAKARHIEYLFWRQLQLRFCAKTQEKYLRVKYGVLILFTFICVSGATLIICLEYYYGYFWYAFGPAIVLRFRCLQFSIYADLIGFYLEGLNMKLMAILSSRKQTERRFLDVNYKKLESLEHLLLLKGLYHEITELSDIWHACFRWSSFSAVVVVFLDLTVNSYWAFLSLLAVYEIHVVYFCALILMALFSLLFVVCFTCHDCNRKCRRTASLVHKLLLPRCRDINALLYNDLVNEFSMQIADNPIEFQGLGFFTIDLKLLMAIFASLVTHMVILLQFRMPDETTDQASKNYTSKC